MTLDQLQRRGWTLANRCNLSMECEGTVNHLLLHCAKTRVLWELLFSLFGTTWVISESVRDTLFNWKSAFKDKERKKVWRAGSSCLFWTVWKMRNEITFRDGLLSIQKLKTSFVVRGQAEFSRWTFDFSVIY